MAVTSVPWFEQPLRQFQQQLLDNKLAHALLLPLGNANGAQLLLNEMTQLLFCYQNNGCGSCKACLLLKAGTHPDLHQIVADGNQIKVDQIRQLSQILAQTSQQGGPKLAIIKQAEKLNEAAANSLLKTLEEPSAASYIILQTEQSGLLPATILSRLQKMTLVAPGQQQIQAYLSQHNIDASLHWQSHIYGGPIALLDVTQDQQNQLQTIRKIWGMALRDKVATKELAQYTAEMPALSLQVLCYLLQSKLLSIAASQPNFADSLVKFIQTIGKEANKLTKMPTVNYHALCQDFISQYHKLKR
ncbi:hypothetical protein [Paraferrimonas sp. SM1919]|uniref:hypothetical protein n=1 Tax=Paraferrimonas sp. SM1919 TaxID=2662263 RepID=UPI0013D7DCB4|nr:hypothetical protein [Paraferrimonas sp. SM1919]